MAKMRIYEIARSIKNQFKDIKTGDLVKFLNYHGFEVKSVNSNIEDDAIGFLMNAFRDPNKNPLLEIQEINNEASEKASSKKKEEKVEKEPKKAKTTKEEKDVTKEQDTTSKPDAQAASDSDLKAEQEEEKAEENKKDSEKTEEKPKTQSKAEKTEESVNNTKEDKKTKATKDNKEQKDTNTTSARNDSGKNKRIGAYSTDSQGGGKFQKKNTRPENKDDRNKGNKDQGKKKQKRDNFTEVEVPASKDSKRNQKGSKDRRNNGFDKFDRNQNGFDGLKSENKNSKKRKDKKNQDRGTYHIASEGEMSRIRNKKDPNRKGAFQKPVAVKKEPEESVKEITIPESLTIRELAEKMKMPASAIVKKLFLQGKVVTVNQDISFDEAEEIAMEFDIIAELEEKVDMVELLLREDEEPEEKMKKRPPVVCVMGHVDHGKTSLLDAIRQANVSSVEAGGITQHIGAYVVEINGEKITFLDTPGHEAFTSMRMRGAQSTDIAVLVVAADDGVMPQTVEAINHAKAAGVEIIVAINKIDKAGANIERVKQELAEYQLVPEDWGGSTVFVPVSAHTREGIDQLLEMIVLTAEVMELKANPDRRARGIVIEARLDKGRGPVATVLVQKGVLKIGDHLAAGTAHGKVRAMIDYKGERVKSASPSTPVEILGLNGAPAAGEIFLATETDKEAKQISQAYIDQGKDKLLEETKSKKLSLDGLFNQIQQGNVKELNLIIKADVQGSVEAVKQSLMKLGNEEVVVNVIHGGVGAINESDVSLAIASNAIIIGFNIRPDNMAKDVADRENVDIRLYKVIYDAIEDIENALKGMLEPIYEEKVIGHIEVRQTFKSSDVGTIAGSYVLDGNVVRGCKCRVYRGDDMLFDGPLQSLKRFKDDVKEVKAGYECGLVFEGFSDVKEEDRVECYVMVEVPR